jgi:hypothetical protein
MEEKMEFEPTLLIMEVTLLGYSRVRRADPLSPSVERVPRLSLCYGIAG